jgi:hypothetical protein
MSRAAGQRPASAAELEAITTRGRMLAEYDVVAWAATDAVMALRPPPGTMTHYLARRTGRGWQISFGHFNVARDTFLVVYMAVQNDDNSSFAVTTLNPPLRDTHYLLSAARAADVARSVFHGQDRLYNVAVLPVEGREWWVYLYPAQSQRGVWPLGADARYRVSADGARVLEERRLHNRIIEYGPPPPSRTVAVMTHNAILDEKPEDTDVMMVLRRVPAVPEIVVTKSFAYRIKTDGSITYMGRRQDFTERDRP